MRYARLHPTLWETPSSRASGSPFSAIFLTFHIHARALINSQLTHGCLFGSAQAQRSTLFS